MRCILDEGYFSVVENLYTSEQITFSVQKNNKEDLPYEENVISHGRT